LQTGDHVADLAGLEPVGGPHRGREEADFLRLEARAGRHRAQVLARAEASVDDANEGDDAAVLVVRGVEDERPRRSPWIAGGRRILFTTGTISRSFSIAR